MLLLMTLPASADVPDWSVVPLGSVLPDGEIPAESAPILASVSGVSVQLVPGEESRLTLTYALQVFADGLTVADLGAGELTMAQARLDGREVAVPPSLDGRRLLVSELTRGRHTLVLTGVMPTPTSQLALTMPQAPVDIISVRDDTLAVDVVGGAEIATGHLVMPPSARLSITWKPAGPPPPRPDRLEAMAAVGLTVGLGGVEGAGVVRFDAIHGEVETVRVAVPGVDWAEATGSVVLESRLVGGWLEVDLAGPQSGRFSIDVALRGPAGAELNEAPLLLPEADRREVWVSLYQGEEGFVSRETTGLEVVTPAAVPQWGQDLASGRLLSSLHTTGSSPSLQWKSSEWESVETPGTVVDEARYEVAVVAHGRALTRARYQVRNDRGAWLWLDIPEDGVVLAVRVAGNIVEPVTNGARLGIPLEKSVETLTGLVSFPVEVSFLSSAPVFSRRGQARLTTPALSAPVADARWTLYLPPSTTPRRVEGNVQPIITEPEDTILLGRGYGRGAEIVADVTGASSTTSASRDASQDYWNQAYDAYKDNRFDEAGDLLEQSLILNPDNAAASALQGNVVILTGETKADEAEVEQVDRVKAMARAKSGSSSRRQETLVESAEEQLWAGNVDEAITLYESAIEVSDQLSNLESDDDYVQKAVTEDLRERLKRAEATSSRNRRQMEQERRVESVSEEVDELKEQVFRSSASLSLLREQILDEDQPMVELEPEVEREEGELARITNNQIIILSDDESDFEDNDARGEVLSKEFLARIPEGRSYQSASPVASPSVVEEPVQQPEAPPPPPLAIAEITGTMAGVFGGENPNTGGASGGDNTYTLDGVSASESVTGMSSRHPVRADRQSGRKGEKKEAQKPANMGPSQPQGAVATTSAFDIPEGVTASRWIVLVPESGPVLYFSRQLVPAGEGLEVVVPYRMKARRGKQGG